jgi:segregation and condensation protein A
MIEQHRLPITDVSLAQMADQYLSQVYALQQLDPELLAGFLSIASKLLLLKSRALLLTEQPDALVEETASDLADRLATYRVFRTAAGYLQELEQRGARSHPGGREPAQSVGQAELVPVAPAELLAAYLRLRQRDEPMAELVLPARASVDERRTLILDALERLGVVSFRGVAGETVDTVVATFLAILELFRRDRITIHQPEHFADLTLRSR